MPRPLSDDLRRRLIDCVSDGMSRRAAAERFGVAASTAVKWLRRWRESGVCAPCAQGGDRRSARIESHGETILGLIAEQTDITLSEIAGRLEREHGERFALSAIWRFLDRRGQTLKKNRARQRARASGRGRAKTGVDRRAA